MFTAYPHHTNHIFLGKSLGSVNKLTELQLNFGPFLTFYLSPESVCGVWCVVCVCVCVRGVCVCVCVVSVAILARAKLNFLRNSLKMV